ncbi:right-handed parallel beta-helix repeat-containing protein [PVC group bacterium]|nr:right-handed parallel beta-helix repeat-containing protein [PVC group bacterium]
MSHATIWLCGVTVGLTTASILCAAESLYVAPHGDDNHSGTMAAPFATLERARDAVRKMMARGLPTGGVTVYLRGGVYGREATFELRSQDSGTPQSPIVYRSYQNEEVRLVGGLTIPAAAFGPVAATSVAERLDEKARGNVRAVDLKALGVTDFGKEPVRYRGAAPVPELFFDDKRMTLARWPNEGWATIDKIIQRGSVPRSGDKTKNPGIFQYKGDRPSRWRAADEVRLHGYWCFDWYDEVIKVKSIDTENRQITFAAPHYYGIRYGNRSPRRYRAIGLLEEIDEPGECYIDRKSGVLYFWPPAPVANARIVVSTLRDPVISLTSVSHVTLRGLTIEACIGNGIAVKDGEQCQILACHVRNTGKTGIDLRGGVKHRVEACDIHDTGTLGMTLAGGDRRKLIPAGHEAVNNHI